MSSPFHLALPPMAPAVPLAGVPGPKLQPFTPTGQANIEFIEFVSIDGHSPYALKMFLFRTWETLSETSGKYAASLAKPEFYVDYLTPFSCECQAYGRSKQEGREDLVVKSHGYLLLTREQEIEVTEAMGVDGEQLDEPDSYLERQKKFGSEQHRSHPIYAIVKDFVPPGVKHFTQSQVSHLWSDVEALHRIGILVRDLYVRNYMDGKLVDFSRAWTMYHPCLDINPGTLNLEDARELLEVISSWLENTPLDSPVEIPPVLKRCAGWYGGDGEIVADPSKYD
ncbi:LOW QUALITY PROTEIN: hypothetical protein QC763_311070 [Podospora pseudopauciseta]|uniref:Uncharacterized protein n=1 Tax=Podospora pseudopauciseta TaxID=2093780 RepID=A0ABR0HI68_9PEZI|nr:LOW QUALITY PROTEIN: hypothetical protein QC763_311070 [Podospora pseudopauciseta]